jgi:hypothetical protein
VFTCSLVAVARDASLIPARIFRKVSRRLPVDVFAQEIVNNL